MVPRLIFAALVFCSLASRPETGSTRRRGPAPHAAQAQAVLSPPRTVCP